MPAALHLLILVLAVAVVWLWLTGQLGVALVWFAIAFAALAAVTLAVLYARRLRAGTTPARDLLRARASLAFRRGHPGEAVATYADARDAAGIRRVVLEAANDAEAADALARAAEAYFALTATIATAGRHGVVPSLLLARAGDSADAAAAHLWRSCDRLAVVGSSQSERIDVLLRSYERAVRAVGAEFESARDGIVQVAVGAVLEAQLADITRRLARLDGASRAIDESMADVFG